MTHISQEYEVFYPDKDNFGKVSNKYTVREYQTALAVYSIWNHFLDVMTSRKSRINQNNEDFLTKNKYTRKPRLKVFIDLSKGQRIELSNSLSSCNSGQL